MKKNNEGKPRVLIYDIENSYTVGAVWGLYEQNVAEVLREPYFLTFSCKWLGESKIYVFSLPDFPMYKKDKRNDKELVLKLREFFDEADIIIAHNGNAFDQKMTYARFAVHKISPPSPSKYIDTKLVAKSKFKFNSNSLNNLGKYFKLGEKIDTGGIKLWIDCIENNDPKAWAKMCKYNKQDVVLLEKVYKHMLPYMTNHPNLSILNGEISGCPNCASLNVQKRGFSYSKGAKTIIKKQRISCMKCGSWYTGPRVL